MTETCGSVAVTHEFASSGFKLDFTLELVSGWNVLFGPSGAGKSTVLRAVAGLLRPDGGRIQIDQEVWFDSAADVFRPAEERRIGFVAQRPVLFPHLSIAQNVVFGLDLHGPEKSKRAGEMLELFHCSHLADRHASELSGGEQQRVALARAAAGSRTSCCWMSRFAGSTSICAMRF